MVPEIEKLKKLNYIGWDGYSAPPITPILIAKAEELWNVLVPITDWKPTVTASSYGIWFEWCKVPSEYELSVTVYEYSADDLYFSCYLWNKAEGLEIEQEEVYSIEKVKDFVAEYKLESVEGQVKWLTS